MGAIIKEPLTNDDIKKEAQNRCNKRYSYLHNSAFFDGFIDGVTWRINSVWHDIDKELPEYNKRIVNEDWFDFIPKDEKDLKRIISQYQFKRWAYVEDLLPNKED